MLRAFRTWTQDLPESVSTSLALLRLPDEPPVPEPLRGQLIAHLRYAYVGDDPAEGERLLAPMRSVAPAVMDLVAPMQYAAIDSIHQDPEQALPFWQKGILLRELTDEAVDALLDTAGPGVELPLIAVELRLMGGRLARQPEAPNAVAGRDGAYSLILVGLLTPQTEAAMIAAADRIFGAVSGHRAEEAMINFMGPEADPAAVLACFRLTSASGCCRSRPGTTRVPCSVSATRSCPGDPAHPVASWTHRLEPHAPHPGPA